MMAAAMAMEPAGPTTKKRKLAAVDIHELTPATLATEAPDLQPPTTAEESQEPPRGAEEDGGESLLDRISNLCDAVLGEIITLLPTKEGARTQILSSRWRHLWHTAPLNLDYLEADVGVVLSAHQGSCRRICLPLPRHMWQADDTDAWLRSPALDNLQELEFDLSPCFPYPPPTPPPATFRFSSTLRIATFSQCHLPYRTVKTLRFAQLKKLAFFEVEILERSMHSIVALGCPVLESLMLNNCRYVGHLRINSPTLISIGFRYSLSELTIEDAPSLQRLVQFEKYTKMQVTIISAPKLETLGYISEWFGKSKIVFGSTVIQELRIDSLAAVVCTVKILAINLCTFDLDMVVDLMRFFPCLEKFYVKMAQPGEKRFRPSKHRNLFSSLDTRLKTLVLGCYRSTQPQVKLATFVVSNARMLESVRLEVDLQNYKEVFFAEQHRRLGMEKRASRDARLCFAANCPHDASTVVHLSDLDLTDPFACAC
uniref:Uncharacterized protein n=1 Tax=Avena sativa TaxID=4498 RepID=A0ACD5U0V4_AVESA